MTRAKETLTLFEFLGVPNPYSASIRNQPYALFSEFDSYPPHDASLDIKFEELGLADVDIDFAGRQSADSKIHEAISDLRVGDQLKLVEREFQTKHGIGVARLAKNYKLPMHEIISIQVCAIPSRYEKQVFNPTWRERLKVKSWETVLCSIQMK